MSNEPTLDIMHTENTAPIPATTFPALHAGHCSLFFDDWWNDQENGCPTLVLDNDEQFARAVWDAAIKSTNTMSNEPTPRSREEWRRIQRLPDGSYTSKVTYGELAHGMSNFAEQLERELAELQEHVALCHDALGECRGSDASELHTYFSDYKNKLLQLTAVTEQRDALAEALRVATAYPLTESWYKQAIEALATLKP